MAAKFYYFAGHAQVVVRMRVCMAHPVELRILTGCVTAAATVALMLAWAVLLVSGRWEHP